MTAMDDIEKPAIHARGGKRFDLFDGRAEELGAVSEGAKAELAGVDTSTLWRWRQGHLKPSVGTLLHLAGKLDVPMEQLAREMAA